MAFVPQYDLMDGQVSSNDLGQHLSPIQRIMLKLVMMRKKNISPNPADGFQTTNSKADSDAEGAGDATTSPGATPGQQ